MATEHQNHPLTLGGFGVQQEDRLMDTKPTQHQVVLAFGGRWVNGRQNHPTSGGFGVRQGRVGRWCLAGEGRRIDEHQNHPTLGCFGVRQGIVG